MQHIADVVLLPPCRADPIALAIHPGTVTPLPRAARPTPEQIAKKAVATRSAIPGQPDRVEVTFRFTLAHVLMERLTARAIRQRSVEAVVAEVLEAKAE